MDKNKDASANILFQGRFGDITLHVVVAYTLPFIRLAPPAKCQRFLSHQSEPLCPALEAHELTSIMICSLQVILMDSGKVIWTGAPSAVEARFKSIGIALSLDHCIGVALPLARACTGVAS
jgi:hypothetical protein